MTFLHKFTLFFGKKPKITPIFPLTTTLRIITRGHRFYMWLNREWN